MLWKNTRRTVVDSDMYHSPKDQTVQIDRATLDHLKRVHLQSTEKKFTRTRTFKFLKAAGNTFLILAYVVLGGIMFSEFEEQHSKQMKIDSITSLRRVIDKFDDENPAFERKDILRLIASMSESCRFTVDFCGLAVKQEDTKLYNNIPKTNSVELLAVKNLFTEDYLEDLKSEWNYRSGMYFAFTTITTIGYGNIAPSTPVGRMFFILYALIGIPMFFWVIRMYGEMLKRVTEFISRLTFIMTLQRAHKSPIFHSIVLRISYYGVFVLLFICLPTVFYKFASDWSWTDSIYFITVTLTTVGFGDILPSSLYADNSLFGWVVFTLHFFVLTLGLAFVLQAIDNIGKAEEELQRILTKRLKRSIAKRISPPSDEISDDDNSDETQENTYIPQRRFCNLSDRPLTGILKNDSIKCLPDLPQIVIENDSSEDLGDKLNDCYSTVHSNGEHTRESIRGSHAELDHYESVDEIHLHP